MKLIPNTIRPWPQHFPLGSKFYLLDVGEPLAPEKVLADMERNMTRHGTTWAPTSFVTCTVTHLAEGAFEYAATRPLRRGNTSGSTGLFFPFILNEEEMRWLQETLKRLGTVEGGKLQLKALGGDEDAMAIVWYCQLAQQYCWMQHYADNKFPFFEANQFLLAARECVL